MSRKNFSESESEYLKRLLDEYRDGHSDEPFTMYDVAYWAHGSKKWIPPNAQIIRDLAARLSRAAKLKKHTDLQGRRVRSMHAAKYPKIGKNGQLTFETMWDYMEEMSLEHATVSFTQRWHQLVGGARSLKTDVDSFNDNNVRAVGKPVQLAFNFEFAAEQPVEQVIDAITPDGAGEYKNPVTG
jgi:hypothetical protein